MLIDGYKWDLRIYVAITSINPLRIYVYEEGLCRFASEKYDTSDLKNIYSHLTNYSINKKNKPTASSQYNQMPSASKPSTSSYTNKYNGYRGVDLKSSQKSIASNDRGSDYGGPVHPFTRPGSQFDSRSEFEFRGHTNKDKWTLKAFKEYMRNLRQKAPPNEALSYDVDMLFKKIHDIVIKTIISAEPLLWNGVEMYLPNTYQFDTSSNIDTKVKNNNCFELLGFDILVDENFKPWLLEVNLSPSLNTDTQLDFKVKGGLIADLFTLVGL